MAIIVIINVLIGGIGALMTSIYKTDDKSLVLPSKVDNKIMLGTLRDVFTGMVVTFIFCYIPIPDEIQAIFDIFITTANEDVLYGSLMSFFIGMSAD